MACSEYRVEMANPNLLFFSRCRCPDRESNWQYLGFTSGNVKKTVKKITYWIAYFQTEIPGELHLGSASVFRHGLPDHRRLPTKNAGHPRQIQRSPAWNHFTHRLAFYRRMLFYYSAFSECTDKISACLGHTAAVEPRF